ncbi:MAG: STAS domain-containing protein [Phycisphaerae bacterium]|nr:STAS domain-containing protein [Phycisphaerae bacterium]
MPEDLTHLTVTRTGNVHVIEFADRKILEELSIAEIGDELNMIIDDETGIEVLLCFRNVEHLSSAALGMLIKLKNRMDELRGKLMLSDISPQIYEVFKITKLNKLFHIYDTADEALKSL